jgi:hypothetical protein
MNLSPVLNLKISSFFSEKEGIIFSSTQPASSSHPQPQQFQGQRLSRGRGCREKTGFPQVISQKAMYALVLP